MNLVDIERACKLAELAGTGIVLKADELRWLLDTQARLREQNAELLAVFEAAALDMIRDVIAKAHWRPNG